MAWADVQVGWMKIYAGKVFSVSVRAPIPDAEEPGTLVDINAWPLNKPLPARFILGDGSVRRAALLIDQSPGSELATRLDAAARHLKGTAYLSSIRQDLAKVFGARWSLGEDETGDNPWDPAPPVDSALEKEQETHLGELVLGGVPEPTDRRLPIVPLEKFLEQPASAYCIEKALFTRLLLDRLGVASRFVAGAKLSFTPGAAIPRNLGHSWLMLADGRLLDPTDHKLGAPSGVSPLSPDWFGFQGEYRVEDQMYPMLVLE